MRLMNTFCMLGTRWNAGSDITELFFSRGALTGETCSNVFRRSNVFMKRVIVIHPQGCGDRFRSRCERDPRGVGRS
jgi:hypothetical protein